MKLGLSLSGGGIKGVSHIGAIKALDEAGIKFDYISGTSSGSIVATLYACGYNTDEIYNIFKKYAKSIKYVDFVNFHKPAVNISNEKLYVFSNNILKNKTDEIEYINDVDIGSAVQASCSYPGIFSPCRIGNNLLVDGGIAENLPWRENKRAGAEKVLSIVFEDKKPKSCCKNLFEVVGKSYSILNHELNKYEWDGTDYLLKIKTDNIGLLDKSKMSQLYKEGYFQTKNSISEIKMKLGII